MFESSVYNVSNLFIRPTGKQSVLDTQVSFHSLRISISNPLQIWLLVILPIFAFVFEVGVLEKKCSQREDLTGIEELQMHQKKMNYYMQKMDEENYNFNKSQKKEAGEYTPINNSNETYEFNTIIEEEESLEEQGIFDIENSQDKEQSKNSEENLLGI